MGYVILDFDHGDVFGQFYFPQNKLNINKCTCMKKISKCFYTVKAIIIKAKRYPIDWIKVLSNKTSEKLIFNIWKVFIK